MDSSPVAESRCCTWWGIMRITSLLGICASADVRFNIAPASGDRSSCQGWFPYWWHCKAQCTAENWTELDWTELDRSVQLSSVQFSAVHWTGNELWRPATVLGSQEPSMAISKPVASRRSSSPVFVQRQTLRWLVDWQVCLDCEEPATNADFVAESSQVVAGSVHSGKLNWTEQLSWVEFSFPLCIGL